MPKPKGIKEEKKEYRKEKSKVHRKREGREKLKFLIKGN